MRLSPFLMLAFAGSAWAVPLEVTHQGRLLDSAGDPLTGAHTVTVRLYDASTAGTQLWTDAFTPTLDAGYFTVVLGSGAALPASTFDGDSVWMGLSVDAAAELPRLRLRSVPFAVRAAEAATADTATTLATGAAIDVSEIRVGGTVVIDGTGTLAGDDDTLGELACTGSQLAVWNGTAWACDTIDAALITRGTVAFARLPVGGGASQVAAGNHTHHDLDGGDLISGTVSIDRLPVGDTDVTVSRGDHTHDDPVSASLITGTIDIGNLPVGPSADEVAAGNHTHVFPTGDFAVDSAGSAPACGTSTAGALWWDTSTSGLKVCDGAGFRAVFTHRDGSTSTRAATSCKTLHAAAPYLPDGVYWIDPTGQAPFQAYCLMSTNGGGWTLFYYGDNSDSWGTVHGLARFDDFTTGAGVPRPGHVAGFHPPTKGLAFTEVAVWYTDLPGISRKCVRDDFYVGAFSTLTGDHTLTGTADGHVLTWDDRTDSSIVTWCADQVQEGDGIGVHNGFCLPYSNNTGLFWSGSSGGSATDVCGGSPHNLNPTTVSLLVR